LFFLPVLIQQTRCQSRAGW